MNAWMNTCLLRTKALIHKVLLTVMQISRGAEIFFR